jgi:hypothetical protein
MTFMDLEDRMHLMECGTLHLVTQMDLVGLFKS